MGEGGDHYCSKKSDDICGEICDQVLTNFALSFCFLRSWIFFYDLCSSLLFLIMYESSLLRNRFLGLFGRLIDFFDIRALFFVYLMVFGEIVVIKCEADRSAIFVGVI